MPAPELGGRMRERLRTAPSRARRERYCEVVVCVQLAINVGQNVGYMAGMKDQVNAPSGSLGVPDTRLPTGSRPDDGKL